MGEYTSFEGFQELIAHLRSPEGCPWDQEQTHQSLRTNLLEEAYEAIDAIDHDNQAEMQEEFGDLLLQVVLQTQIASEYGEFNMTDVIRGIHTKLVRRHPHVFGDVDLDDAETVIKNWERIKAEERNQNHIGKRCPGWYPHRHARPLCGREISAPRCPCRLRLAGDQRGNGEDRRGTGRTACRRRESSSRLRNLAICSLFSSILAAGGASILKMPSAKRTRSSTSAFAAIEAHARAKNLKLSDMSLDEMEEVWQAAKK